MIKIDRSSRLSFSSILIITFFTGLLLFNFEKLTWKTDIGIADFVNIFLALITLTAVRYSKIAAESALTSTELTSKSLMYTHKPKLIPIRTRVTLPASRIDYDIGTYREMNEFKSILKLKLTNVFKGNAYNVSAWLSIEEEVLDQFEPSDSSKDYNTFFDGDYRISFSKTLDKPAQKISMAVVRHKHKSISNESFFYVDYNFYEVTPLVETNQSIHIYVPSYVALLIKHLAYNQNAVENFPSDSVVLNIRYKTNDELDSNHYHHEKYRMYINEAHVISNYYSGYKPHIMLDLDFLYIN